MIRSGLVLAALSMSAALSAQRPPEYPDAVPQFLKACAAGDLTAAAREASIAADNGWTVEPVSVDVEKFNLSGAVERNFDFSKPLSVKQWSRTVDGVPMRLVLATFPEKRHYPVLCSLVVPNVQHGWPYDDAFEAGVKAIGLKGKSTDLPHYFEYSGKVDGGKHPVRAEVSGRTRVVPDKNAMHLYIAF